MGYKLAFCDVKGSRQLCPPGMTVNECPAHFACYMEVGQKGHKATVSSKTRYSLEQLAKHCVYLVRVHV